MATYTYTKTIEDQIKFLQEVKVSSLDETKIIYIEDMGGGDIKITTLVSLSESDETALDALIAAHPNTTVISADDAIGGSMQQISIAKDTKNNTYTTLGKMIFDGTDNGASIFQIKVIAYMQNGADSYDIRVIDGQTSLTIAEKIALTNTTDEVIDLGAITNLPTSSGMFYFQIKKNGNASKRIYLDTALFKY
jgi:hypothetical protein